MINDSKSAAFLINPIESLDLKTDSSLLIAHELQKRKYKVFYFLASDLAYENSKITANGHYFKIDYDSQHILTLSKTKVLLDNFDVLFIRQNPPFDQQYLTITYLLETLKNTLILNHPTSIRNITEKLSIINFSNHIPVTAVYGNVQEIKEFILQYKTVIIKPLYDCAGRGVTKVTNTKHNLDYYIKSLVNKYQYIMLQKYLPEVVTFGDKRVILMNGDILAVINRKPQNSSFKVNIAAGGQSFQSYLTNKEIILCQEIGQFLKEENLFLVGIDIINGRLIEINVTSPTGLVALNNLYKLHVEKIIVDQIERKIKNWYNSCD